MHEQCLNKVCTMLAQSMHNACTKHAQCLMSYNQVLLLHFSHYVHLLNFSFFRTDSQSFIPLLTQFLCCQLKLSFGKLSNFKTHDN